MSILVDNDDAWLLETYYHMIHKTGYVRLSIRGKKIALHRAILGLIDPTIQVDHINHNKSDNHKVNLRIASPSENSCNTRKLQKATSTHKGIYWNKRKNKWMARICKDGKRYFLGYFEHEKTAYDARVVAARRLHGDFAY